MTRAVALCSWLALSAWAGESPAPKPRVAVLYFDINSTDAEQQVLKKGLCEMLISDIAADAKITVVERNRLEEVMAELDLQHTKRFDPSTAQQVGKLVGAQYLVMGSLNVHKQAGRLDAKVLTVQTGVLNAAVHPLKDGDVFEAESRLAEKLNAILARAEAHDPPPPKKQQGKLTLENAVKYSQALDAIDKKDKKTAKEKLDQVVKAQPDFLLASLELDRLMK